MPNNDKNIPDLCQDLELKIELIYQSSITLARLLISNYPLSEGSRGLATPPSIIRRLEFMNNNCDTIQQRLDSVIQNILG